MRPVRLFLLISGVVTLGVVTWRMLAVDTGQPVEVKSITIPDLTPAASAGAATFAENCASCHGEHASGGPGGPPLIHIIYEPSHHPDRSFHAAVANGVRQHHWRFGNMPAIKGVDDATVAQIVTYVREVQRANGID